MPVLWLLLANPVLRDWLCSNPMPQGDGGVMVVTEAGLFGSKMHYIWPIDEDAWRLE